MSQTPESISCPRCGNLNAYSADECLKCNLPLGPIRDSIAGEADASLHNLTSNSSQPSVGHEQPMLPGRSLDTASGSSTPHSSWKSTQLQAESDEPSFGGGAWQSPKLASQEAPSASPHSIPPSSKSTRRDTSSQNLVPTGRKLTAPSTSITNYAPRTGGYAGTVSGYQESSEGQLHVRRFRLDHYDVSGNLLRSMAVEMRGIAFQGNIKDGDEVEVEGEWAEGHPLIADKVFDTKTGVVIRSKTYGENFTDGFAAAGLPSKTAKKAALLVGGGFGLWFLIVGSGVIVVFVIVIVMFISFAGVFSTVLSNFPLH